MRRPLNQLQPFPASNDPWSESGSQEVRSRLENLSSFRPAAALVVGAGSLPYTLDVLPQTVIVADQFEEVHKEVIDRCQYVAGAGSSWDDYRANFAGYNDVVRESNYIQEIGLAGDYQQVQAAARRVTLVPLLGDITMQASALNGLLRSSGSQLTFVNFTNVSTYLAPSQYQPHHHPQSALVDLLQALPVHPEAVICDSSLTGRPVIYTPESYIKQVAIDEVRARPQT